LEASQEFLYEIASVPLFEIHLKEVLSLLYSILASENTKLKNLMERQLTVNKNNP
jgi:hypothetical protein